MTDIQENNPLHGLKLEILLQELVDFYGWEIMGAAMKINCFVNHPTMEASLKFLRKTTWAREKVEAFYLYRFKNLPRPNDKDYVIPPRDRLIPFEQQPGTPVVIDLDALPQPQAKPKPKNKPKARRQNSSYQSESSRSWPQERTEAKPKFHQEPEDKGQTSSFDPWSEARKKFE